MSFNVGILDMTDQCIHCVIKPKSGLPEFFCTFIYGFNEAEKRLGLWEKMRDINAKYNGPWLIAGDLNTVLKGDERLGSLVRTAEMLPGRRCIEECGMTDIPYGGHFYTWSNKQEGEERVYSKIDRVMANEQWLDYYNTAHATFLTEGPSDHCPALIKGNANNEGGKKPFKYFRMWALAQDYQKRVEEAWKWQGRGTEMYVLTRKLKKVKNSMKELNREGFNAIQAEADKALQDLIKAQEKAHNDPRNSDIIREEKQAQNSYDQKQKVYTQFLKQKAKCHWLQEGDQNTAMFHRSIKKRRLQNTVYVIKNQEGQLVDTPETVAQAFQNYYIKLLGERKENREQADQNIIKLGPILGTDQTSSLLEIPTNDEIRKAMFSIKGDKAPGPDGFGSYFFQDNWRVIGDDICNAVRSFFRTGKLLKEVNTTFLTLIPKMPCPTDVTEFRPIACCNTIYKCITKILCVRLKEVLPNLIAENQGAFVHGRFIIHNIMICQELVRKYGRKNASPSCMIKLDLRKAYDTVEWDFIQEMMEGLGFPRVFIDWVLECVTTPKFSIVLNGCPYGFFKSKRGLRQGDPLSPLLFVICMEYLSRVLKHMTKDKQFKHHPRCRGLGLTHLCFADDLILCSKGDRYSIQRLLDAFHHFSMVSGLEANNGKTEVYSCGMAEEEINSIIDMSGFKKGRLPFKYLGVPICSRRISVGQCEQLVEKITARIRSWGSRHLSFAGRSLLINTVLLSLHQYWAQVFVIPQMVLKEVEKICRAYLWSGVWSSNSPGYIAWEKVCRERKAGGLGFRDIFKWNIATIGRHVWALETKQDNLWVKWIHSIYLKDANWWDYNPPQDCSWYWKKICEARNILKLSMQRNELAGMGKYSVRKVYEALCTPQVKMYWTDNVWSRYNVPKHRFCMWLAIQNRLPTMDRLSRWVPGGNVQCLLCSTQAEDRDHLFFKCSYSSDILHQLKKWIQTRNRMENLERCCKWVNRMGRAATARKATWNLILSAAVVADGTWVSAVSSWRSGVVEEDVKM
ncbi:LINE-1 retrotransposable element ORF2 protein [Bienertia sinuspersici]